MLIRVLTYNILDGGKGREKYILEVIQSVKPDVVVVQEVINENILNFLAHRLQMQLFVEKGKGKRRVGLLSHLPVKNFKSPNITFPMWRNFIEAEIQYQPDKVFKMFGVHLIANLWVGFELWRLLEIRYITKYIQQFSRQLCLLAGDFNTVAPNDKIVKSTMPYSLRTILWFQGNQVYRFAIRFLMSFGYIDCYRLKRPNEDGYTLPPPAPNTRLDYFFVNRAMERQVKDCWVVREPKSVEMASDHYPVVVELNL